jgi:ATP-dependent helicase HrpB
MLPALPIDELLPSLCDSLRSHNCLVLKAPPGAGKTTRVPPALLAAGLLGDGQLIVLEPRRIAARSAARRIAAERGERVGETCGYRVRFDEQVSSRTRIVVMTEGILLRRLQSDPFLEGVSGVVFDEFHERRLESDLALAMCRRVQETVRPDLRLVAMSATLDPAPIARYLGDCPQLESPGRQYPVEIRYAGRLPQQPLAEQVVRGLDDVLTRTPGDVLVFLPGVGEIRQAERLVHERFPKLLALPLYGDLPPEEQDRVLLPAGQRKVVLSTNVAETSVTIEGITAVVDTGLARIMQFDPESGLDRLQLSSISQAAADQRAGRAGRTQPGVCLRLWDEVSQRHRPEFEVPEVRRVDLSGPFLQLKVWGEADPRKFPWYETPAAAAFDHAEQLLEQLGALRRGEVTPLGQRLAELPVQPRLARLMLAGEQWQCRSASCLLAAWLAERDPFQQFERQTSAGSRSLSDRTRTSHSDSDVVDRLEALQEFYSTGRREFPWGTINNGAARQIAQVAKQFEQILTAQRSLQNVTAQPLAASLTAAERLQRALLAAYPDRLARRREPGSPRGIMVGGRGVKLGPRSAVCSAELFLCIDLDGAGTEATVRLASGVRRDWLPAELMRTTEEQFFHPSQRQVVARRRVYWFDLVLDEVPCEITDRTAAAELLYSTALQRWEQVFPADHDALRNLINRWQSLKIWMPELDLPPCDQTLLEAVLKELCAGCRSLAELKQADWVEALRGKLSYAQQQLLDREAPTQLTVPSGSRITLQYEPGRPPVLAVRIQEVFGLRETPRIAGGRVPVLLHLLAPNLRPQQVTDDLASFWKNTYAEVKKELKRRYPKHAWPDDPLQAPPQRKPGSK